MAWVKVRGPRSTAAAPGGESKSGSSRAGWPGSTRLDRSLGELHSVLHRAPPTTWPWDRSRMVLGAERTTSVKVCKQGQHPSLARVPGRDGMPKVRYSDALVLCAVVYMRLCVCACWCTHQLLGTCKQFILHCGCVVHNCSCGCFCALLH